MNTIRTLLTVAAVALLAMPVMSVIAADEPAKPAPVVESPPEVETRPVVETAPPADDPPLKRLYGAPEREASFVEATRTLIGFKLPPALIDSSAGLAVSEGSHSS